MHEHVETKQIPDPHRPDRLDTQIDAAMHHSAPEDTVPSMLLRWWDNLLKNLGVR